MTVFLREIVNMWSTLTPAILAALSLNLISLTHALPPESDNCEYIYNNPRQDCSFNFYDDGDDDPSYFLYTIETGRYSGDDFIGYCPDGGESYYFAISCNYRQRDGGGWVGPFNGGYSNFVHPIPATITVPLSDLPVSSLYPGVDFSCNVLPGTSSYSGLTDRFTLRNTPTPRTVTATVVVPTEATSTSTTTSTLVGTSSTTTTLSTVSVTKTGKATTTLSTRTSTTITITPAPRTMKKNAIFYTTTTLSCIPTDGQGTGDPDADTDTEDDPTPDSFNGWDYSGEAATCYSRFVTPTITTTQYTTSTNKQVIYINTSFQFSTTTTTITAPAPTSYTKVTSTVTKTKVETRSKYTVNPVLTTTKLSVRTNTVTKWPAGPMTYCGGTPAPRKPRTCRNPRVVYSKNMVRKGRCDG
ncbi:hypothetical protein P280DRAFT_272318 [Massarina eburnea CBS 473.64]|uniref:Uncharacterized protein n=1 Tax=Massarina eburnea CBS 473.64 TaxID=1395130 RepID=A0A6A6S7J5_9PLEO|nr:hypothetical protein P280DRAFT_272318 [Massarina eburnea CBS 473.64]